MIIRVQPNKLWAKLQSLPTILKCTLIGRLRNKTATATGTTRYSIHVEIMYVQYFLANYYNLMLPYWFHMLPCEVYSQCVRRLYPAVLYSSFLVECENAARLYSSFQNKWHFLQKLLYLCQKLFDCSNFCQRHGGHFTLNFSDFFFGKNCVEVKMRPKFLVCSKFS